ncbi:HDOD domain-containing protein [Propionivibrio dicarboxylicus]|uniref:HD-like signal output (HDOD) domain, no enzymatic activity n=1 Tax=Propionivibrio dicarboxylicus TaxID=83767 RepID=A0A1G7XL72_9RHOO|nr:HDOD domain-containing protein [Propionivibrio dicarboxylicus]SDG84887.1 HD-like signal output (HDOD) domain, no enzymatic activity [Propionivibrio dicarboxylicus]
MLDQPLPDLDAWIAFFSEAELPILRQTGRRLEEAQVDIDKLNGRDIATIVLQDPLMAVRVLSYIQPLSSKRLHSDITNIGNAIMMQGVYPFFANIGTPPTIETMLRAEPQALLGVLQVIRRAQRASRYAHDWAFDRHDMNIDEVTLAALLHDLPETLLWCFAPKLAMAIRDQQQADPKLRSAMAQEKVLGIRLVDMLLALCDVWHLPNLLRTLMDDNNAHIPRVQNVTLAVNLARHSVNGWENQGLHEDFAGIEKLMRLDRETLLKRLDVPEDFRPRFMTPAETGGETPPV